MGELNWSLIKKLTLKGVWLGLKSGSIVGSTLVGGLCVFFVMVFSAAPNFPHDKFGLDLLLVYLLALSGSIATGVVLGLLIGFHTGILSSIFMVYLPNSGKYRTVTMWAAFFGGFSWGYLLAGSAFRLQGSKEMIGLILACYGSWLVTRLISFVEDSLLGHSFPEPATKDQTNYTLTYRISLHKREGLSRYQIDRDLLESGRTPEELEKAWQVLNPPAPLQKMAPARQRLDLKNWGKVVAGAVVPVVLVALLCWIV